MGKTGISLLCLLISFHAFSGSVDYLSNQSPGMVRNFSRTAATGSLDGILYNPAGLTRNRDGLYLSLGNQYLLKDYTQNPTTRKDTVINGDTVTSYIIDTTFKAGNPTFLLPNMITMYKRGKWGGYLAFGIPAGGGELKFEDGISTLHKSVYRSIIGEAKTSAKLKSVYYGINFGMAFAFHEMISISLGGRGIIGRKKVTLASDSGVSMATGQIDSVTGTAIMDTASMDIDMDLKSQGIGAVIGINISPARFLDIGLRYETRTVLDWETTFSNRGNYFGEIALLGQQYQHGGVEERDLPPRISAGAAVRPLDGWEFSCSWTYHMITAVNWRNYNDSVIRNEHYDNGYDLALGIEYSVMNRLLLSSSYNYADLGGNSRTWSDFEMALDAHAAGLGGEFSITPGLGLEFGYARIWYVDGQKEDLVFSSWAPTVIYTKDVQIFALALNWKIG
ncbi:OmpP1/FadL family transporter [Fibrobacterota bacterium]